MAEFFIEDRRRASTKLRLAYTSWNVKRDDVRVGKELIEQNTSGGEALLDGFRRAPARCVQNIHAESLVSALRHGLTDPPKSHTATGKCAGLKVNMIHARAKVAQSLGSHWTAGEHVDINLICNRWTDVIELAHRDRDCSGAIARSWRLKDTLYRWPSSVSTALGQRRVRSSEGRVILRSSLKIRRVHLVPSCYPLIRNREIQKALILAMTPDQLHRQRQSLCIEASAKDNRRMTGDIERQAE